jgi:hypothetical protein
VRRAVVVLALVFVLALGVVFSARNFGIARAQPEGPEEPYCKTGTQTVEAYHPTAPASIRDRQVKCWEDLQPYNANTHKGSNNPNIVDLMLGRGKVDMLFGQKGRDAIDGGSANDHLGGGKGNDAIIGGAGQDTLKGGPGKDTIFAREGFTDADQPAQDKISCGGGTDKVSRNSPQFPDETVEDQVAADCEIVDYVEPEKRHWWRQLMGR